MCIYTILHCVQHSNRLYGGYKINLSPKGNLQGVYHHDAIVMFQADHDTMACCEGRFYIGQAV